MATEEQLQCVHQHISIFSGVGSIAALLGMSTYFMSYEYQDFDRVGLFDPEEMKSMFTRRHLWARVILVSSLIVYIAGLILLALSMSLYRSEKEAQAADVASLLQQVRNANAEPDVNEPAILAGVGSGAVLIGMAFCLKEFHHSETFGWIGPLLYGSGWLCNAFAAAMNSNSVTSLKTARLAWTLPGASLIVGGTFLFPWQFQHHYISGPAFSLVAIGYGCFGVGNSFVTDPPVLEEAS